MPKTLVDIIPPSKRRTMEEMRPSPMPEVAHDDSSPPPSSRDQLRHSASSFRPQKNFPMVTAIVALLVILGSIGALLLFSGAEVEVTPAAAAATVQSEFTATATVGDLPYETISVEKIVSKSVPAETTETANDPAQGTITIYNTQDKPQTLINNTRFESPTGLIFRVRDSVTVPKGTGAAPGTLSVTIYADEAGESYNIGPAEFTLPGLSGSDLFTKVYAKSTEPMQGGYTGERPAVSGATKEAELQSLREAVETELIAAIRQKVPEGYTLLTGASFARYEPLPDTSGAQGTVDIRLKGIMQAVVFPEEALAKAVAFTSLPIYNGEPVEFGDVSNLVVRSTETSVPVGGTEFSFTLSGEAVVVWKIDTARIAGAVAEKKRASAEAIISGFPEVERAVMTLRPFWKDTFPADPEKIKIIVTVP